MKLKHYDIQDFSNKLYLRLSFQKVLSYFGMKKQIPFSNDFHERKE